MNDDENQKVSSGSAEEAVLIIDVAVAEGAWEDGLPQAQELARDVAAQVLDGFDEGDAFEVSLVLADDALLQQLNRDYRQKDKPTNVLSFPADTPSPEGEPELLGDVILSYSTCRREAEEQGKTLQDHFTHLLVHGLLHLLGFDHEADAEAEEMEALEREILADLGIADPYN
ncbi:rRNA maturation RNase YbeY [Rhodovibrionaceae bacterium A322]